MTHTFLFFFGGFPKLSYAELNSLLQTFNLKPQLINSHLAKVDNLTINQLNQLKFRLGGTVKIARLISQTSFSDLNLNLIKVFNSVTSKNLAVTNYLDFDLPYDFISQLKSQISRSVRFLSFKTRSHSLVALRKQHVLEINLISQTSSSLVLAETVWIQDSDLWVKLDRQRPYQDIKRGMLPPKIARIMVNLATQLKPNGLLADPFCGTGTIALEASRLGYQVFASDLDKQAVQGTFENLNWLANNFSNHSPFQVKQLDAVHLNKAISSVDFIVTEPFMGILIDRKPNLTPQQLKNNIKGLNKLYLGALKNWQSILSSGGRVVMIFPEFHLFGRVWSLPLIDTCEKLGYNKLAQLTYSKPQAKVVRQILILTKN